MQSVTLKNTDTMIITLQPDPYLKISTVLCNYNSILKVSQIYLPFQ